MPIHLRTISGMLYVFREGESFDKRNKPVATIGIVFTGEGQAYLYGASKNDGSSFTRKDYADIRQLLEGMGITHATFERHGREVTRQDSSGGG